MKKTSWVPIVIGIAFGLLSGIANAAGLTFNITLAGGVINSIGFYAILYMLSAALGGPLAGFLTAEIDLISLVLVGSPDMKAYFSDPITFWTNSIGVGVSIALVGFAYRLIYQRFKMPMRLLLWIGIVIFYYIVAILFFTISYHFFGVQVQVELSLSEYYLTTLKGFLPQLISDIVITSLIWIALPEHYRRPLWYEPKK